MLFIFLFSCSQVKGKYSDQFWLGQTMKSSNHFIIMAISGGEDLIGFVHYQLCWFQRESKSVLLEDGASDLVVYFNSVQMKNDRSETPHSATTAVNEYIVLICLALEHCRTCAMYGMANLCKTVAPVLQRYFRMSQVNFDESSDKMLIACDLEKYSYKYVFSSRVEEYL